MHYNIDIDSYIGYPISKGWVRAQLEKMKGKPTTVRVNSYGGDVNTALDIRQQFIDHGDVTVHFVGMSASAATILAMGARKITMSKHALLLVHQCSSEIYKWAHMNKEQIRDYIKNLSEQAVEQEKIDTVIANIYAERTGMSIEDLANVMSEGKWLTAEDCLAMGIVDAITEDGDKEQLTESMAAHFSACGLPLPTAKTESPEAESPEANETEAEAQEGEEKPNAFRSFASRLATFFSFFFPFAYYEDEALYDDDAPRGKRYGTFTERFAEANADGPDEDEAECDDAGVLNVKSEDATTDTADLTHELEAAKKRIEELEAEVSTLRALDGDDTTTAMASEESTELDRYATCRSWYDRVKNIM